LAVSGLLTAKRLTRHYRLCTFGAVAYSTWAPKAIATIRTLADTLEDRAVVVRLQRKAPGATVERLGRRDNADFAALRIRRNRNPISMQ
jgi:hypothetical protein